MFPWGRWLAVVLFGLGLPWCLRAEESGRGDWLPLAKGNYWVYRATTRQTVDRRVRKQTLTWRMEVTETFRRGDDLVAAVVKGFPGDLSWYEPDSTKPGDFLFVRVGASNYYLFEGDKAAAMRKEFAAGGKPSLKSVTDGGDWFIDGAMARDKRYGGSSEERLRGMDCWLFEGDAPFSGGNVKGLPANAGRRVSSVTYNTNHDHTSMELVPGVGIVGYVFEHRGIVAGANLRLVEVHLEKP